MENLKENREKIQELKNENYKTKEKRDFSSLKIPF